MIYKEFPSTSSVAAVPRLDVFFERFTKERQYLKAVTSSTLAWYRHSFHAFQPVLEKDYATASECKAAVIDHIQFLKERGRGNQAVSINTYLRWLKTFLRWCHEEKIIKEPIKLSWLKEEQKILPTFTKEHVQKLLSYKPVSTSVNRYGPAVLHLERLHTLVCLFLDSGLRLSEGLALTKEDIDLDNLIIKVKGKGGKHRLVPMSIELRKVLFRWQQKRTAIDTHSDVVFCTSQGTKVGSRDFLRDFKKLGSKLGIEGIRVSPHTLRHTFAVMYLRKGGNLFYLSRILGHSSLETTQKYLQSLGIEDLQAVHSRLSLLTR